MSFMHVDTDALNAAAVALMKIATDMKSFGAEAAPITNGVVPWAKDPVSVSAATCFVKHAAMGHEKFARVATTLERYAVNLELSAAAYSVTEIHNTKSVQST